MKIKKSLVEQIIKEEALKIKRVMVLKEEKNQILKQLNELYEEQTLEEGVSRDKALAIIQKHPMKNKAYQSFLQSNPEKAEAYINFFMQNPNANYPIWDDVKKIFYNKESYATHSGAKATSGPGQYTAESTDSNADALDEKFLGMGTDWNNDEEVKQKFYSFWDKKMATPEFERFKKPAWASPEGGQFGEKAIEAVKNLKSFDIKFNPNTGEFTRRKMGAGFGGQNIVGSMGGF